MGIKKPFRFWKGFFVKKILFRFFRSKTKALVKAFDTTRSIYEFLLTCVEWVASRADFCCDVLHCRASFDYIATSASNLCHLVFWVNTCSHSLFSLNSLPDIKATPVISSTCKTKASLSFHHC